MDENAISCKILGNIKKELLNIYNDHKTWNGMMMLMNPFSNLNSSFVK